MKTRKTVRLTALALAILLLTSVLAACSTQSASTATPTPTTQVENAQGVTDNQILIGNCAATSGAFGPVGIPYIAAIEAYCEMVNEKGGINGREIKFIHYDDEMSPEKGMALYDKLINDDKVFAIVGCFGTPVVGAVLPELIEKGIPAVYFATGMPALYNADATGNERCIMPVQPIYTTEGHVFAAWSKGTFKATRVAIIYSSDDAGKGVYEGLAAGCQEYGLQLVAAEQVPYGAEDVSAAVTKVLAAEPDIICNGAMQNTFLTIGKELGKQGNTAPMLTSYVNAGPTYFSQFAADIKGKYDSYAPGWVDMSQGGDDVSLMGEYLAKVTKEDYSLSAYAMSGWIAAKFFCTGLERLGDGPITWEGYIDAMESEPIGLGFGSNSYIDYSNGKRFGTETLALYRMDMDATGCVVKYQDFKTVDQILAGN